MCPFPFARLTWISTKNRDAKRARLNDEQQPEAEYGLDLSDDDDSAPRPSEHVEAPVDTTETKSPNGVPPVVEAVEHDSSAHEETPSAMEITESEVTATESTAPNASSPPTQATQDVAVDNEASTTTATTSETEPEPSSTDAQAQVESQATDATVPETPVQGAAAAAAAEVEGPVRYFLFVPLLFE